MLSALFYTYYRAAAVLFFGFGVTMLVFDDWSAADRFPWPVSPFVTATWGTWWIGAAVYALDVVRLKRVAHVAPLLVHLWLLPILELAVIVYYNDRYQLGRTLSAPYLLVLTVGVIGAVIGIVDLVRLRPSLRDDSPARIPVVVRVLNALFVVAVLYLGIKGLTLKAGGYGTEAKIFPDPLWLISARTFGAFYTAVALSAVPVLLARGTAPLLVLARDGTIVIVLILLAAAIHLGRFDFVNRPGGWLYIGAYVAVGVGTAVILWCYRRHQRREPVLPGAAVPR